MQQRSRFSELAEDISIVGRKLSSILPVPMETKLVCFLVSVCLMFQTFQTWFLHLNSYPRLLYKWKMRNATAIQTRVRVFLAKNLVDRMTNLDNPQFKSAKVSVWCVRSIARTQIIDICSLLSYRL